MNTVSKALPPGQFEASSFDRFGLGRFSNRFPANPDTIEFTVGGDVEQSVEIGRELAALPRVEQVSDFHCVTTWSCFLLRWSGVRFSDFYQQVVVPMARPKEGATFVVLRGQDGYRVSMQLEDLLAADVMLADSLNGSGLGLEHGAPLRLIAPAHYGYKNMKHIAAIEFWQGKRNYRFPFPYPDAMDHPRGRVALEERSRFFLPTWVIRFAYRAIMPFAKSKSRRTLAAYRVQGSGGA